MKGLLRDERGIEPIAVKILVGIILAIVGIGIGIGVYYGLGLGVQRGVEEIVGPDFTASVSPSSATIGRPATGENSRTFSISVERLRGYDKTVTLSYSPTLTGVTITFSPSSGTPTFGSTMTIRVDNGAALGTTTITIRGTDADGKQKTATFALTVA